MIRSLRARCLAAWLAAIVLMSCPALAAAHTRSESFLIAEIERDQVRLVVTLPDVEVARVALSGAGRVTDGQLVAYLNARLAVLSAGRACVSRLGAQTIASNKGFRRLEMNFQCPGANALTIRSSILLDSVPSHVMFARLRVTSGASQQFIEQLITGEQRVLELDAATGASSLQSASFFEYIRLGIEHILTGPDHLAFVLGFVLISRRKRDLFMVITGFTVGHSVTLGLAVTGWLDPRPEYIDVLIALTIALIGAENFVVATRRAGVIAAGAAALLIVMTGLKLAGHGMLPASLLAGAALFAFCYLMMSGQIEDGGKLRLVVTTVFGLIHGFAFAKDLIELHLPTGRMAELLFGFNAGVEIGQVAVVAMMLGAALVMGRLRIAPQRALVVDVFSAGLVGLGLFWLVSRTYAA